LAAILIEPKHHFAKLLIPDALEFRKLVESGTLPGTVEDYDVYLHDLDDKQLKLIVCFAILIAISTSAEALEDEQVFEKTSPTSPELKGGDEEAALRRFTQDVLRIVGKVNSERDYPRLARDRGWQGSTMVRIGIGADGLLKAVTVTRSSGYSVLDDRAVSKILEIRLPNIPDELRERAFSVDVPFTFRLRPRAGEDGGVVLPAPSLQ
jgi:TonB family protein